MNKPSKFAMYFLLLLLTIVFSGFHSSLFTQNHETITMQKAFLGYKYYYRNEQLNRKELHELLDMVPSSQINLNIAKRDQTIANIFGYVGGFLIGWPIGETIAGAESPNWYLAGIGGVLLLPGFLFESKANDQYKISVEKFNMHPGEINFMTSKEKKEMKRKGSNYYTFTLKSGTKIEGKLLSKYKKDLYVQNKNTVYLFKISDLAIITDNDSDMTDEALNNAKEEYVDLFNYVVKEIN